MVILWLCKSRWRHIHPYVLDDHCVPLWPRVQQRGTDGVMTSSECTIRAHWSLHWSLPSSSGGWGYGSLKDGSSARRLGGLGCKVGQLMPGSLRAKWTSMAAVQGSVLEESPGRRSCQDDVKLWRYAAERKFILFKSARSAEQKVSNCPAGWFVFSLKSNRMSRNFHHWGGLLHLEGPGA